MLGGVVFFFFFKLKTAYEMRISDWRSGVCSTDLPNASFVYVQKWRDGIAVEMQEGGGKAYRPEVLAKLDEDPDAFCILPMTNRSEESSFGKECVSTGRSRGGPDD